MSNQKRKVCRGMRLFVGLFILASYTQGYAQPQNQSAPAGPVGEAEPAVTFCPFYLIVIEVKVADPRGKVASSLGRDDFTVYDNGAEQQITMWAKLEGSSKGGEEAVYAIAYPPVNLHDGKFHKIRVVARGKNRRKLRAKLLSPEGYDAKGYLRSSGSTPPNNGMQRTRK